MRTVTFYTHVHDSVIRVPERYKRLETRNIEVILVVKNSEFGGTKGKGILRKYKNPALISKEKTAWEMTVKEKYAHR